MTDAETNNPENTRPATEQAEPAASQTPPQQPKPLTMNRPAAPAPQQPPTTTEPQPEIAPQQAPATPEPQPATQAPATEPQPAQAPVTESPATQTPQPAAQTSAAQPQPVTQEAPTEIVAQPTEDKSPEEETEIPENYFLIYPSNEAVVTGDSRELPDLGTRIVFLSGIPLLIIGIVLIVIAVTRWMTIAPLVWEGNAAPPNTILNGVIWTAAAFFFSVFVIGWFLSGLGTVRRRRGLKKRGQLVWGEVVTAVGKRDRAGDLFVTVEYQFKQPDRRRKKMLTGTVTEKRNDLKQQALPTPESPVAVLYLHPKNYELL